MATLAMHFPESAAALCQRDVAAQQDRAGQSSAVFGGSQNVATQEFSIALPDGRVLKLTVRPESESVPAWIRQLMSACSQVLALPENWDSYGARRIRPEIVVRALGTLTRSMPAGLTPPSVVPLSDGGIQLEWHRRQQDLEITFAANEPEEFFYRNKTTGEERDGSASDHSALSQLLQNLV